MNRNYFVILTTATSSKAVASFDSRFDAFAFISRMDEPAGDWFQHDVEDADGAQVTR
jgi:hypothetical protein